jgi:prepilin-type N-terminal cleavage/methylation domain-containing protein
MGKGVRSKKDKKNYQYINIAIGQYNNRKGFTLIEIMVALVVFAVIIAAAGSIFTSVQQSWQRQREIVDLVQNVRWALEFIVREVRQAGNVEVTSKSIGGESTNVLRFELPPGGPANRVWYWRGNGGGLGDRDKIYRGRGANIVVANSNRQELANFIVTNPSGNSIFDYDYSGRVVTIELTVRPDPNQPVGIGNQDYTLRSRVRPRN